MVEESLLAFNARDVLKWRTAGLAVDFCSAAGRSDLLMAVVKARELASSLALSRAISCASN